MRDIAIRRPRVEEVEEINDFFAKVIRDTFKRNGIDNLIDELENEIKDKRKFLNQDFRSNGQERYFLIAIDDNTIIASIEYGKSNDLINECTKGKLKEIKEVGTIYVHPKYQNQGIGSLMLQNIFNKMQREEINEFCLDSGYKIAQKIWQKKFGEPQYHLKDYWDQGSDHMIWNLSIKDVLVV